MTEVSFGEWLKRQRSGRGLTQQQLAHQIGCAVVTLRKIEAEERRPSPGIVERLAEIFEIPKNEQNNFLKYARGDGRYAPGETIGESPWRVTKAPRTNLPASLTPLIGREGPLAELHDYLRQEEIRLVTLIGPPGVGKTRIGMEAARQSLFDFPDGVFFVQLAQYDDPSLIASTTRQALGYVENQKLTADQQLQDSIGEKQMLIVLDNCEHLINAVAEFAAGLLSACPRLKIMATSREAIRIPGEWLVSVPGLEIPKEDSPVSVSTPAQFPALTLFAERARAVRSDFVLTPENLPTLVEICTYLDGLPLAIELMAAQLRYLSPQALLERLNETFVLSAEGARTVPSRQISLRHAFHWSYDSLTTAEQKVFAGLSVFSGSFTLQAAEVIFSETELKEPMSKVVLSLLDKSLLQRATDAGEEIRFSMLVVLRQFAQEHLRNLNEATKIRDRHLGYFLEMAEHAEKEIHGPQQLRWFDRLECEHDNLRAALTWALESKKADAGLRMASALGAFWFVRGYLTEGIGWLERGLAQEDGASKAVLAKALSFLGVMLNTRESRNPDRAIGLLEQSLSLCQELQDASGIARAFNVLGVIALQQKDHSKAKQFLTQSLILRHQLGDPWSIAQTLQNFPPLALYENNPVGSKQFAEETINWFTQAGDQRGVARTLADLAELEHVAGNTSHAIALLKQSLSKLMLFKDKWSIASVLDDLAALANMQNNFQRAVRLYAAAESLREAIGMPHRYGHYEDVKNEQNLAMARTNLDELTFAKAWKEGRAMTMERAIAYALENGD